MLEGSGATEVCFRLSQEGFYGQETQEEVIAVGGSTQTLQWSQ